MRLWLYKDIGGWGEALLPIALERGHDARLFVEAREVDEGSVFVHMHHHPDCRGYDKDLMLALAGRGLTVCPHQRAARLYDDKLEQTRQLARWMPATLVLTDKLQVFDALKRLNLPLISKTSEGAGSNNVRLIETREAAFDEAEMALRGQGIPCRYDQAQVGYLLWQEFLPGNDYDFRVIAVGRERLILRRGNRDDQPMASGSGNEMPIEWPDAEASEVLAFADQFFTEEDFRWCGVDIVRDHARGRWAILEVTVGWPLGKMGEHRFVSGRSCDDFWPVVMDEIEAGTVF